MWSRRDFLASAAAAPLAIDGGTPVRSTPLRARHFGPLYYDNFEWGFLQEVLKAKSPFRFAGFNGPNPDKVATLEREFAAWMKTRYALAVTSGTAALETAIAALGVGPGDEVIIPAWTWYSCFHAVVRAGALPVCAEIDETFNLNPADVERKMSARTKVLMIVHLQGNPADMDALLPLARKRNVKVLEDVSQAVGASFKGKPLGSMGDIAAASLQVNKTISAGEGGMVYTNDPALYERACRFHDVGFLRSPHQEVLGGAKLEPMIGANFRMNEFTGAVLLAQIRKLDRVVSDIRAVARRVYNGIDGLPGLKLRKRPDPAGELGVGVFIEFSTKQKRDLFMKAMSAENVPARPPGGSAVLPVQPYIEGKRGVHANWPSFSTGRGPEIKYGAASCPRTLDILDRFAGPSLDPKFSERDTDDIVAAIRKVYPKVA
jgi:8-amino-3,8-dideoxy-alpha-D-manno-octulosonate transaminase